MSNILILFLWYLAGALCAFSGFAIFSAFTGGCDSFDKLGTHWIILKSLGYGGVTLILGVSLMQCMKNARHWWLIAVVAVSFVILDCIPFEDDDKTIFDRAIAHGGYLVSRIHPYEPVDAPLPKEQKFVIPPNHKVIATTPLGEISLTAGNGSLRTIRWEGVTRKLALISSHGKSSIAGFDFRSSQADPSGYIWEMHQGIAKCHYSEVLKNCHNSKEAAAFVKKTKDLTMPGVASSDGLIVEWSTEVENDVLSIFVTQLLVKGKKPSNLAGADDSKISLTPCK